MSEDQTANRSSIANCGRPQTTCKKRGVYKGRRRSLGSDRVAALRARATAGEPKASLAREFGISRQTLYQYLRLPEPTVS
jgi:DNA invertase Pin-like site-specific DNA recombinase